MDRKAAILLLATSIIILFAALPFLTKVERQVKHNFSLKPLEAKRLMKGRHYGLIKEAAYVNFIQGDFEGSEVAFRTVAEQDSFTILATSLSKANKDRFNRFFYNAKTPQRLLILENFPARVIDNQKEYGFRVARYKLDSLVYLQLPYDMIMGPLQKKNETQYEKTALVKNHKAS